MRSYKTQNNIFGWITFAVAAIVYLLTIEPTASWWDCGEFIASAFKLEPGHPPGAPLFILLARVFSLFSFGNVALVAKMINILSALVSAFAVLFLFWSITALAKKITIKSEDELNTVKSLIIFGSGMVGALAFCFSDSFWFSAVEGEVYAMSAFFTAIVFWAIIKWEAIADQPHADKWIILIAFLIGLSIGVHLLNLLAIPAIAFVYYFKKYKTTYKGIIVTFITSCIILAFIQYGIIPEIPGLAATFELLFVNSFGLPFWSGVFVYALLIIAFFVFALRFARRKNKYLLNIALLSLLFIIIGYTSYITIVIRANANPPLNENNPSNPFALVSYLNREQYGDRPLFYGQYFNAKAIDNKETSTIYIKGKEKYIAAGKKIAPIYDPSFCGAFPRMYSPDEDRNHPLAYKIWSGMNTDRKPTFSENLRFFFKYQIDFMYWRYFLWNFVGRQNDIQGYGLDFAGNKDISRGNWISGISFIDNARLGPQNNLPEYLSTNKGKNTFYFLPLLLGLIGLIYHFKKSKKDASVVALLFFFTGLAIVIYLNQTPFQPRERDYSYAGSFFAFAIWIGLGVAALCTWIAKNKLAIYKAIAIVLACLILVPGIMASEGWDDHDRSLKYSARDFAINYLQSCPPNAVLITNGDNDTFSLWYAQEVEGIRTDVRVVNFILASGVWYIHQLGKKVYDSDPLPFTLRPDQYEQGTNDFVPYYQLPNINVGTAELKEVIDFIASDNPQSKLPLQSGEKISFLPTKKFRLTVDVNKLLAKGIVQGKDSARIVPYIEWTMRKDNLYKNELMLLDFIATNNWDRPICFISPSSVGSIIELDRYCQLEGFVYRFLPLTAQNYINRLGGLNTDKTYDFLMNKSLWGGLDNPKVYVDPESFRNIMVVRSNFSRLAESLFNENKKDSAVAALDRCVNLFPNNVVTFDYQLLPYVEIYYACKAYPKGNAIAEKLIDIYSKNLSYYASLKNPYAQSFDWEKQQALAIIQRLQQLAGTYGQRDLSMKAGNVLQRYAPIN